MHFIYSLVRVYPYWGLSGAVLMVELGVVFRRKRSRVQYFFWTVATALILGVLLWFIFRVDLHSDEWIRSLLG